MVGDEDQPVDMLALDQFEIGHLAVAAVQRGEQRDGEAASVGFLFDGGDEGGEEGVGDVRNDEPDGVGAAAAEPAGMRVGPVVELADGVFDALACLVRQRQRAVEQARHRRDRHAGGGGDILQAGCLVTHDDLPP